MKKVQFPSLNGLRFFAALMVLIHHVEQFKDVFHLPNYWGGQFIHNIGKLGVVLFFSLSGFLITYLLLVEKKMTGRVSVRGFYMRRILRIWPLYFLIVALALFVLPMLPAFRLPGYDAVQANVNLPTKIFMFVFFLPNLLLAIYPAIPFASQTWSIGTEEQFYLVWPWLFKWNLNKYAVLIVVVLFYLATSFSFRYLPTGQYVTYIKNFLQYFRIDCMAVGGLFALLYFDKVNEILRFVYNPTVQILVWIATPVMMFFTPNYLGFAFLFSIIILNLATNERRLFSLENRVLNYLGKISYGLYMYHPIAIVLSLQGLLYFKVYSNWVLYLLSIGVTMLLAGFSYKLLEKRFIKMKGRWSKIVSGDSAADKM